MDAHKWFKEAKYGMMVHWGLYSRAGQANIRAKIGEQLTPNGRRSYLSHSQRGI